MIIKSKAKTLQHISKMATYNLRAESFADRNFFDIRGFVIR